MNPDLLVEDKDKVESTDFEKVMREEREAMQRKKTEEETSLLFARDLQK